MSPVFKGSRCGSTLLDETQATAVYLVDNITEPTPCKLYVPQEYFTLKVVLAQAFPVEEGQATIKCYHCLHPCYHYLHLKHC